MNRWVRLVTRLAAFGAGLFWARPRAEKAAESVATEVAKRAPPATSRRVIPYDPNQRPRWVVLLATIFFAAFALAEVGELIRADAAANVGPTRHTVPNDILSQVNALRFTDGGFGTGLGRVQVEVGDTLAVGAESPPGDIGAGDFTIEMWMRYDSLDMTEVVGGGQCNAGFYGFIDSDIFVDRDRNGLNRGYGAGITSSNFIAFSVDDDSSNLYTICNSTTRIGDLQWHHVALTRDVSNGELCIFIDGVEELCSGSTSVTGDISYPQNATETNNNRFLTIGFEHHDAVDQGYDGDMYCFRVSTIERYTGTFTPPVSCPPGDASHAIVWDMNEGTGTVLNDRSGSDWGSRFDADGEILVGGSPTGPVWISLN